MNDDAFAPLHLAHGLNPRFVVFFASSCPFTDCKTKATRRISLSSVTIRKGQPVAFTLIFTPILPPLSIASLRRTPERPSYFVYCIASLACLDDETCHKTTSSQKQLLRHLARTFTLTIFIAINDHRQQARTLTSDISHHGLHLRPAVA